MSDIPKCTSWRGHKFEARYSYVAPQSHSHGKFEGTAEMYERMMRASMDQTYERDICIRCGHVIERKP